MKQILYCILVALALAFLWASIVIFATVSGWLHKPIAAQKTPESFSLAIDHETNRFFVGNFAMASMTNGVVEYEKFYTIGTPVHRNTVFQVASLSKWISAFGIMKLVEDGKLDLNAPVSKYLTRWKLPPGKFNNDEVTVARLLSHTAGLGDGLGYSGFEDKTHVQSIEQSLTKAADADEGINGSVIVTHAPGSKFKYSGGGYTLLQLIVEEVTGQSFNSYMKESVFGPLGMTHSTYIWNESSTDVLAEFYNPDSTRAKQYYYTSLAATSLYSSLSDLELFFQAHLAGKGRESIGRNVITPATVKKMREPYGQEMGVDIWGLGTVLFAPTNNNDFIIGHDGKSTPPLNTAVRLNPETGDGIIILETGNPRMATKLASEWVFWKTGKVDTFLFPMMMDGMIKTILIGWLIIIVSVIILSIQRRKKENKNIQ